MASPDVFISYRRLDSGPFSQWLAASLRARFGENNVCIDVQSIRDADIWASRIKQSLLNAKIVIAVIGKTWLTISDDDGRRRIDLPGDWVRQELELGLKENKIILPLLINDAKPLTESALPREIAALASFQARRITGAEIEHEIVSLANDLGRMLGKEVIQGARLPVPALDITPLDEESLNRLEERLPGWSLVRRQNERGPTLEITKRYWFESFSDAIHFINTASRFIEKLDHHPEWTNLWRNVIVYLTTWDIKSQPSILDIDLATYLDNLYKTYQPHQGEVDVVEERRRRAGAIVASPNGLKKAKRAR